MFLKPHIPFYINIIGIITPRDFLWGANDFPVADISSPLLWCPLGSFPPISFPFISSPHLIFLLPLKWLLWASWSNCCSRSLLPQSLQSLAITETWLPSFDTAAAAAAVLSFSGFPFSHTPPHAQKAEVVGLGSCCCPGARLGSDPCLPFHPSASRPLRFTQFSLLLSASPGCCPIFIYLFRGFVSRLSWQSVSRQLYSLYK